MQIRVLPLAPLQFAVHIDKLRRRKLNWGTAFPMLLVSCQNNKGEVMSGIIKVTTTRTSGWQTTSIKWAKQREAFEIHGVGASDLAFCKELCEAFDYECEHRSGGPNSAAVFTPME
jgi:hypothetical protein